MNNLQLTASFAILFAASLPVASHAQSTSSTLTRAEVRADLIRVERAGYDAHKSSPYYPADIQAAEAKLHSGDAVTSAGSAYGTSVDGATESGRAGEAQNVLMNDFKHH